MREIAEGWGQGWQSVTILVVVRKNACHKSLTAGSQTMKRCQRGEGPRKDKTDTSNHRDPSR